MDLNSNIQSLNHSQNPQNRYKESSQELKESLLACFKSFDYELNNEYKKINNESPQSSYLEMAKQRKSNLKPNQASQELTKLASFLIEQIETNNEDLLKSYEYLNRMLNISRSFVQNFKRTPKRHFSTSRPELYKTLEDLNKTLSQL